MINAKNLIIAGHTRYKAALALNLQEVPCILAEDLTEEQQRAFRIADNKLSELSVWNMDLLEEELNNLLNIDMSSFGFDLHEAEETLKAVSNSSEELDLTEYEDEQFDHECPRCKFKFND